MAVGTPTNLGIIATKASTTETVTTVTAAPAGSAIFLGIVTNSSTATFTSITDSASNTYSLVASQAHNNSTADGVLYVYACFDATALSSSDTITATASAAVLHAMTAFYVEDLPLANFISPAELASRSSTSPTDTKTGLSAGVGYLALGFIGVRGPSGDAFTQATNWVTPPTRVGSTGGAATSNSTVAGGHQEFTGLTSITYAPTLGTSRAWAEILLVYTTAVTYDGVVAELATADDASATSATLLVDASETATVTDAPVGGVGSDHAVSETATTTEAQAGAVVYPASVSETATQTDGSTCTATLLAALIEVLTTADAVDVIASTFNVATGETIDLMETQVGGLDLTDALEETVSLAEVVVAVLASTGAVVEQVTAQDSYTTSTTLSVDVAEILALNDSVFARFLWDLIDDSQNANWSGVPSAADANWGPIQSASVPGWAKVQSAADASWGPIQSTSSPGWTDLPT